LSSREYKDIEVEKKETERIKKKTAEAIMIVVEIRFGLRTGVGGLISPDEGEKV